MNTERKYREIDLSPCKGLHAFEKSMIIYVVKLEALTSSIYRLNTTGIPVEWTCKLVKRFNSSAHICKDQDTKGIRLLEEVVRRIQFECNVTFCEKPDYIVVSTPGTIRNNRIIARSSRLGIVEPVCVSEYINERIQCPVLVVRDTDSIAAGEIYFGGHPAADRVIADDLDFAVITVDQGVGMSLVQNWKITKGAGAAGAIGRLVVEPNGQFNRFYNQRGNLETCIAIPWLSNSIIEEYLLQKDKIDGTNQLDKDLIQQINGAIRKDSWNCLSVATIDSALKKSDPIVMTVMQRAAIYLSRIISAIIAIINPSLIILTGEIFEKSDCFFEMVKRETRRLSWGKAWERTVISKTSSDKEYEALGAAYIGYKYCVGGLT